MRSKKLTNGVRLSGDISDKKSFHTTDTTNVSEVTPTTVDPSLEWKYDGKVHDKGKLLFE